VGLKGWEHHTPAELSGGQQQRVAIARAIVTEPVLLADEPTGNLDTQRSHEIMELLWRLNAEQGITVLMVTHEPDMAAYARRMVRFVDGVVDDTLNPTRAVAPRRWPAASQSPDAVQHHLAGAALHPAQPDALVPHHPGHRDRGQRGDHHGDAGQRRHPGGADQISSLGTNLLQVRPGQRMGPGGGTARRHSRTLDADAIAQQIGGILAVAPGACRRLVAGGRNWTTSVIGSTNAWLQTGNWTLRARTLTRLRAGAAVCLIGETMRRELYGGRDPVGEQLRVKAFSCEVVGVLGSKGRVRSATTRTTRC
jgi:energy-coupling factor transporter ATP-binding protein EcfA2